VTTAAIAINTTGDTLGDALNTADFIRPGLALDFSTMPAFRTGKAEPVPAGTTPPGLTDPGFVLLAGDVHASASPTLPAYVKPGQPFPGFSWLADELAVYPNWDAIRESGYSPFSVANNVLTITAQKTPPQVVPFLPAGYPNAYISGAFCSFPYSQVYGYFEARMKIPAGRGLWPAFWLLPTDLAWPPEFDVMEALGQTPDVLYTTVHDMSYKGLTNPSSSQMAFATTTTDMSQGYRQYGVDWGPDKLRFYLDRRLVFSQPTPLDCHRPMYFIVNLAVGGPNSWPGAPDESTPFPAYLRIASVGAWQRAAYVAA
jgi:beta-glucanase (GH16 family)